MGDQNQLRIVKRHAHLIQGPILETGSHDYGSTPDFRALFPGEKYVGVDMKPGPNVDVALDMTDDFDRIDAQLGGERFRTIISHSVLEHCRNPFKMAENLVGLLAPGGLVFISVPFVWRIHGYPSDYWRFTPEGVKALFPALRFDEEMTSTSTSKNGQFAPIDDFMQRIELNVPSAIQHGDYGSIQGLVVRLARKLRILPFIFDYPYLHPPVLVNMVGRTSP